VKGEDASTFDAIVSEISVSASLTRRKPFSIVPYAAHADIAGMGTVPLLERQARKHH
jgi:hypothetical protein